MKDPLQKQQTPYEVLRVERDATTKQIHEAALKRVQERVPPRVVTAASKALRDPEQRALVDLFLYDPQVLARLTPNPLEDPSALLPTHRASLATAWERQLKASFPDLGIAHALAVQWYWWALHEEERLAETMGIVSNGVQEAKMDDGSSGPAVEQLWQRAIAYWVMLVCSDEFWAGSDWIPAERAPQLDGNLIDKLRDQFHDLGQRYRENSAGALVAHCQELELALSTELRTAKDIARAGIRTVHGNVCCGPLMLRHIGLFENVREQVDVALERAPSNKRLLSLRAALSPYSSIAVLIDNKRFDAALEAIDALPESERAAKEISELQARAHYELGKQQASVDQLDKALDEWGVALSGSPPESTADQIRANIVSTCQHQAAKLQRHQRDEAIAILEKGLELVDDKDLNRTLGEIVTQRGIETFNNAQEKAKREDKGITRSVMAAFRRGLADLERAEKLGAKRAAEQAAAARRVIEQAKSAEETTSLLQKANEAAEREDWDTAAESLRKLLKAAGREAPEVLKKNLAHCLTNRAVRNVNRAIEMYTPGTRGREVLDMFFSADKDLKEAAALDPSSDHIRKRRSELQDVMAKIAGAEAALGGGRASWKPPKQRRWWQFWRRG